MAKWSVREIADAAKRKLEECPNGLRFTELVKALQDQNLETNPNTIYTVVNTPPVMRSARAHVCRLHKPHRTPIGLD